MVCRILFAVLVFARRRNGTKSQLRIWHEHGQLNITQKPGIIKLIPKKGKDKSFLENRRPLSLLNVDCKIATKAIAPRISKVLPTIVKEDQTGYVSPRSVHWSKY